MLTNDAHTGILPDGHLYMMDNGRYRAQVDINGQNGKAYMRWNGGALGVVNFDDVRNRRVADVLSKQPRRDVHVELHAL